MRAETTPLLHNIGGPPRASLVWRGMGRGPASDETERIDIAGKTGSWLRLEHTVSNRSPCYRRNWNSACALLELISPAHGLNETQAAQALAQQLEEHCARLHWPRVMLVAPPHQALRDAIRIGHPLTTFVALAKSTGSVWLRDRPVRLAPLQTPEESGEGLSKQAGTVRWSIALWFPEGIPQNLLDIARKNHSKEGT